MSAYIGDVVKNGLVLYLDAANSKSYVSGSGVWRDLSVNRYTGSLVNGPTFNSSNNGSIVFDGTNDYVRVSSTSVIPGSTSFTFNIWLNYSLGGAVFRDIVNNRESSTNNPGFLFTTDAVTSNGKIRVQLNTSAAGNSYTSTGRSIATGTPKYASVVVNRESNLLIFYIDGTLDASFSISGLGSISSTRPFDIGWDEPFANTQAYFLGTIYTTQVYNRALSPAEILENYNATKGRFDTPRAINSVQPRLVTNGLVMCLDAGNKKSYVSGSSTIFDLSGTGNHGTLNNGPTFSSANNGSIVFDGSNDFISTTNSVNNPQTYTVAAWFKTSTGGGKKIIGFENSQIGTASNWDRHLYIGTDNKIYFGQYTNGAVVAVSTSTYNDNIWHYVAGAYGSEGTTMRLYVDGVSVATAVASSPQSYTGWWRIGSFRLNVWQNGGDGYYTGNVASAHVYNRGLSASEVLQNYNALKGRFGL